jgi:hypothetical protein
MSSMGPKSNRTAVFFHLIEVSHTATKIYEQKLGKWTDEMLCVLARELSLIIEIEIFELAAIREGRINQ